MNCLLTLFRKESLQQISLLYAWLVPSRLKLVSAFKFESHLEFLAVFTCGRIAEVARLVSFSDTFRTYHLLCFKNSKDKNCRRMLLAIFKIAFYYFYAFAEVSFDQPSKSIELSVLKHTIVYKLFTSSSLNHASYAVRQLAYIGTST